MFGLIWMVQVVHYPLMGKVGEERYEEYQAGHMRQISWLVGPGMLIEGATAVLLVSMVPAELRWLTWIGIALLVVVWGVTATVHVPLHTKLTRGFDAAAHRKLCDLNWLRTAAWTGRVIVSLWLVREIFMQGGLEA